jgi:hypothetical protein
VSRSNETSSTGNATLNHYLSKARLSVPGIKYQEALKVTDLGTGGVEKLAAPKEVDIDLKQKKTRHQRESSNPEHQPSHFNASCGGLCAL